MATQVGDTYDHYLFGKVPIMGILRNFPHDAVMKVLPLCWEVGLDAIEITMNTAGATEMIRDAVGKYGTHLNIGAGTVCDIAGLENALDAGATFIVSPNVNEEVIDVCVAQNIPVFPGALTPTEIYKAWRLGADMVKVFPANALGESYFSDVLGGPLSQVPLMATGGVGLADIPVYRAAGVRAFGIGSPMFPAGLIQAKDWNGLKIHLMKFIEMVTESPGNVKTHDQF